MMKRMTNRKHFTLVELLVVIAIITILAALLLPALGHAIYQARTIACMNNLKQTGVGITQYTNDFDGFYPYTCKQGGPGVCPGGAYNTYCRGHKPQQISASHGATIYYTSEEIWPYFGGEEGYCAINICPHTPGRGRGKVPIAGFRNKQSTYNTFWWLERPGDPWRIRKAMRKLGQRWQGDRRWKVQYQWYNVIASDTYIGFGGVYDPRNLAGVKNAGVGPVANHPNGNTFEWQHGQSENGYAGTTGSTSVNSLADDGAVTTLMNVTNVTSLDHLGGYNAAAVPAANGRPKP